MKKRKKRKALKPFWATKDGGAVKLYQGDVIDVLKRLRSGSVQTVVTSPPYWVLRQDIIWHKPSPMPESVRNRCTKAHEYLFLLTKSAKYFYDAEAIRVGSQEYTRPAQSLEAKTSTQNKASCIKLNVRTVTTFGANKRDVWTIPP